MFTIEASYSPSTGWKVTTILMREDAKSDNNAGDGDAKEVCANNDYDYKEGDADDSVKRIQDRTPLKARWSVPLVLSKIAEKSNMSNADMKHAVLANYIKPRFITSAILQGKDNGQGRKIWTACS